MENVTVAHADGNTNFHDIDSSESPNAARASHARELSHEKRAPTWVLTKGLAEEESLPNKTQSPPLGMLDAITAPATETALAREEKRLLASKALYGDDHTVLDTPDSPKQSNVNVDAVQQEQSPKMSVSELNSSQSIALMTIVESDNEEGIEDQ